MIVDLVPTSEARLEAMEEVQALVFGGLAVIMAEKVVVGGFGTINKNGHTWILPCPVYRGSLHIAGGSAIDII